MREKDFLKIRKDTEMYLEGNKVLLHRCDNKLYILSNINKFCGAICDDFKDYNDMYRFSYFVYRFYRRTWDSYFRRECLSKLQYDKEILGCL